MSFPHTRPERLRETGPVERVADWLRALCGGLLEFGRAYVTTLAAPFVGAASDGGAPRAARPERHGRGA